MHFNRILLFSALIVLIFSAFTIFQENQAPVVKLIKPSANADISAGVPLNYEISVADKEDGNSKYDEINIKEVLLELRYFKDKSKASAFVAKGMQADEQGLAVIRTSNCFSCHNFNSKAMGPSFDEVQRKYPSTKINIDTLTKRINAGSTGFWGKEKMPSHPELTQQQIRSAVEWILKNSNKVDANYFIGLNGVVPAAYLKSPGTYVLTASYIDHGLKTDPGKQRLKGQDVVILTAK